jgi:hypothetical protein
VRAIALPDSEVVIGLALLDLGKSPKANSYKLTSPSPSGSELTPDMDEASISEDVKCSSSQSEYPSANELLKDNKPDAMTIEERTIRIVL